MKHILEPELLKEDIRPNQAAKALLIFLRTRTKYLLIKLVKKQDEGIYRELEETLSNPLVSLNFIIYNHKINDRMIYFDTESFNTLYRQLLAYGHAESQSEKNNFLLEICNIANSKLELNIPQKIINNAFDPYL